MSLDKLPFNWFDLMLVVVLALGIYRGRKHGMSEELMSLIKWVVLVLACALIYQPLGNAISTGPAFGQLGGYLIAYAAVALVVAAGFAGLKRAVGGKLLGSDVFGRSEFYLGMVAGLVRFACILIAGLALLNARFYNPVEIKAGIAYQNDVYGSNFFPTLHNVQAQVFQTSLTGPWIRRELGSLLIKPTAPEKKQLKQKEYTLP